MGSNIAFTLTPTEREALDQIRRRLNGESLTGTLKHLIRVCYTRQDIPLMQPSLTLLPDDQGAKNNLSDAANRHLSNQFATQVSNSPTLSTTSPNPNPNQPYTRVARRPDEPWAEYVARRDREENDLPPPGFEDS